MFRNHINIWIAKALLVSVILLSAQIAIAVPLCNKKTEITHLEVQTVDIKPSKYTYVTHEKTKIVPIQYQKVTNSQIRNEPIRYTQFSNRPLEIARTENVRTKNEVAIHVQHDIENCER